MKHHVMFDCQAYKEVWNTIIKRAIEIITEYPTVNTMHKIKELTSSINLIRKTALLFEENAEQT